MFIACCCMYDIRNPANRHPERIEFGKLLKLSSQTQAAYSTKCLKSIKTDLNASISTLMMQQNERSVKSLDEIMDLKEVEDGLKEVKHPNGQIVYIEDNKSQKSQTSLYKLSEDKETNVEYKKIDTSEEEQSVIAMLDNVLETEDDDNLNNSPLSQNYDRKLSVDSEMVPSVIRSTTVATVHSSSNSDSSRKRSMTNSIDSGTGTYEEKQRVAQELVDEILNSQELWSALETHKQKQRESVILQTNNHTDDLDQVEHAKTVNNTLKRVQSVESVLSTTSVDDPLHSEKFRNKLSKLIIQPHEPKTLKPSKAEESIPDIRPKLKHSKSEADVRSLVLKAIEGCNIDNEDKSVVQNNEHSIPKPPQFDPVLYNTINSLSRSKERPSLEKLMQKDITTTNETSDLSKSSALQNSELPFREKLEAILKRGPSHKTQTRPDIGIRRPKSQGPVQFNEDELNSAQIKKKSESNLNETSTMVEETSKILRPVKETASEL